MTLDERLKQIKNPTSIWENRLWELVQQFTELKAQIERELVSTIDQIKQDSIFNDLEPAKKLAKQVAKEEIASFKSETNDKINSVIQSVEKTKTSVLNTVDRVIGEKLSQFEQLLSEEIDRITSEIETSHETKLSEIDQIKQSIDNLRGPKGETGPAGRDGKDADPTSIASLVLRQIPKIEQLSSSQIVEAINKASDKISIDQIGGLVQSLQEIKRAVRVSGRQGGGQVGGGDVVTAGTGITITRTSDGKQQITSTGITAASVNTETPTGDIDGVNVTYTTTATINAILSFGINGMFLHPTTDFTYTGSTITMTSALPADLNGKAFTIIYV